ncbi:hypothetical protein Pcinc_005906 [Petrolisthes cinctipes]|uniref:Nuclease HARBI1 n=1 Tax=Petrolisthes cinctipes TaxID=88211 RepID=A0AAE1GCF7_PETCI|nr:hypothetical protein Pcinc_005906 [Petrolisthes cinctipes]
MFAQHALLQEQLRQLEQVGEVRIPRVIPRDRANPFRYLTEEEFVKRYRLPKNAVQDLIEAIEPHTPRPNNDRGCSIPLFLQMLVTLRYLATGSFQLSVADCADMAVSSVCRCVGRISRLIAYLAPDYIKFPTPAEGHRLAQEYFSVAEVEVDDHLQYDGDEGRVDDRLENAGGLQVRNAIIQRWF